ncbi:MAG TPA: M48 family metalloprotease [Pyrinomonadaceae bacterium]|jgi:predicted Zn-dependent protease
MHATRSRTLLATLLSAALLAAYAAPAAAARQKDEKKKEEKPAAAGQKAAPAQSKQEREYQKIKQFSLDRYARNAEFKDEVDEALRQKQREHSEYAFNINTLDSDEGQIIRTAERMRILDTLYDNPLAQDYVNRVGQSLVPPNSNHLYAFKITLNPIPEARSLSTGTIYVSTGLLSKVDNEAQLAYVLGHEIGHVERNHWFEDVLVEHGLDDFNEKQQQKRSILGGIANVGTGIVSGGLIRGGNMMGLTAVVLAQYSVPTLMKMAEPNAVVTWDKQQEDEADQLGLQYMLARNYDAREVPKFYAALQNVSRRDQRTGLGFMANAARIADRVGFIAGLAPGGNVQTMALVGAINLNMERQTEAMIAAATPQPEKPADTGKSMDPTRDAAARGSAMQRLIQGAMSEEIRQKLEAGQIIGSPAEFLAVMAELKRDNGIRAYYYDMFQVARDNLDESLQIRSNDPAAHFYYGKVLKLTARTPGEKARALTEFAAAIDLDKRRMLPESYLQRALTLVGRDQTQTREIVSDLKEYVTLYQRQNGGRLPPNMDVIYDYMQDAGEMTWVATPATNVSTRNIDPIGVAMGGAASRPSTAQQPAAQTPAQAPAPNPAPAAGKSQPRKRP